MGENCLSNIFKNYLKYRNERLFDLEKLVNFSKILYKKFF